MEDCEDCVTWEESMYWKHFNTFHFTLLLPPNFHDHLVLPKKFAKHMISQLPEKVSLKGPSGAVWEVQLFKTNDLLFVGNEWKDFIRSHDLKENYRLMFKFIRNSTFEVIIFEQESTCEKEASYFVKKCKHLKSDHDDPRKTTNGNGTTEIIEDEGEEEEEEHEQVTAFVASNKSGKTAPKRKGRLGKAQLPRKLPRKGSLVNETGEEAIQVLQKDGITPENGGSLPKNDKSQSKQYMLETNVNGNNVPEKIVSQVTRELQTSENGKNHNNSPQMKNQCEKQPNRDHTVKDSIRVSKRGLITPLSGESNHASGHQAQTEKELSENGTAKELTKNSGRVANTPNYRESSPEEDHSPKTRGKRGRPTKKNLSKSSKKLHFKSEKLPNEYKSNRRSVTDEEKRDAFQRAIKKETEHSFTVILPPSSVYKRFYLSVPSKWLNDHLLHRNQQVVLRVGAETWSTGLFYHSKRGAGISTGWKKFALDNNLEESDVLVFNLSSPKDETPVLMDVDIFRVVPIDVNQVSQ